MIAQTVFFCQNPALFQLAGSPDHVTCDILHYQCHSGLLFPLKNWNACLRCDCRTQQGEVDLEDKEDQFQPQLGNVAFASAHDGWAFRISQLAKQYADKLGCNASGLEQALWGDYAFQAKTKRIIKIKPDQTHKHKPLFVQVRS